MRQIIAILILSIYTVSSIPSTIAKHFCGNNLVHVSVTQSLACCNDCDMETTHNTINQNSGCCSNEFITIDKQVHEQVKQSFFQKIFPVTSITKLAYLFKNDIQFDKGLQVLPLIDNNILTKVKPYIRFHQLLFYA